MEPAQAEAMALRLMAEHKVPKKWKFRFDRSRRRWGQAREALVRGSKVYEITLSRPLVEVADEKAVKNVILHEIAHVLAGLENHHNTKWQAVAKKIGMQFEVTDHERQAEIEAAHYKYWCPGCQKHIMVSQRPVSTAHLFCDTHPSETITRESRIGPEVTIGVV